MLSNFFLVSDDFLMTLELFSKLSLLDDNSFFLLNMELSPPFDDEIGIAKRVYALVGNLSIFVSSF